MRWIAGIDGENCMICEEHIDTHKEEINDKVHIKNSKNQCCSCEYMFELCEH